VNPYIAFICFPVVFVGELPDKTMFASLIMSTRGRPFRVWLGAAAAFVVHVVIATTVGVALFALVDRRTVDAVVAVLFAVGAGYAWWEAGRTEAQPAGREAAGHGVVVTAFVVIFLAEWGDLTQILTANLVAKYHSALSVGVGSVVALWAVAALAVASGQRLLRMVNVATVRRITAAALIVLAGVSGWSALRPAADRAPARSASPPGQRLGLAHERSAHLRGGRAPGVPSWSYGPVGGQLADDAQSVAGTSSSAVRKPLKRSLPPSDPWTAKH
jgi:putative Ca2+/H+ antiporter (TMEM165/GDT1 family)